MRNNLKSDLLRHNVRENGKEEEECMNNMCELEVVKSQEEPSLQGEPSQFFIKDFVAILYKYGKEKNQEHALGLYAYLHDHGLDTHRSLGNHLVSMMVDVGRICDAQQVFDRLVHQNELAWNSLIIGYVKWGGPQHAIALYQKMQSIPVIHPNKHAFVALLKACARLKNLETGAKIHAEVARTGLLKVDPFIGSSLIVLYAKCGCLDLAESVFVELPIKNVVLWNALIAGYAERGDGEEVLDSLEEMQLKGFCPDAATFVCTLKACGSTGAIDKGQEIHAEIERQGLLERNLMVGNTVVDMYAKCGFLALAQQVFYELRAHDIVSWNILIAGYAEQGFGEEALKCFEQMQLEGFSPNAITYVCFLKACGSTGTISKGQEIHAEIERQGLLKNNRFVGSTLVDMYAKCGLLAKAHQVFLRLPPQDVVSWNVLIAGYAEYGSPEETLEFYTQMLPLGVSPDGVTFVCCLKACGKSQSLETSQEIHIVIEKRGLLESNMHIGGTLVDVYAKCGSLVQAQKVFDRISVRNLVSWNALIAGYAEHGQSEEALKCFEQMQLEGVFPDPATLVCCLKACGSIGAKDTGRKFRVEIERRGLLGKDILVGNSLVDMYAKCGLLATAQEVFDKLLLKDTVSWNALIAGYAVHNLGEEALDCFEQMQFEGVCPNAVTFVCSLKACGDLGSIHRGRELHVEIERQGVLERDLVVGNNVVGMYAKCGLLAKAKQVFDRLQVRDVASWTALMTGYAHLGESEKVFQYFDKMLREGVKPNFVTYMVVLATCSRMGLFCKIQTYFEAMSTDHGIVPTLEHHTCVVDLLGRSGKLDIAEVMIGKIPFCSDHVVWHALLESCRKWGNVELGLQAFNHSVCLSKANAGAYISMSHIFAGADFEGKSHKFKGMRF